MKFNFIESYIDDICIHKVGNKIADERYFLSQGNSELDDALRTTMTHYFLSSFKSEELYHFNHSIELPLNETYVFIKNIFENPTTLYEQSINLAKHLYNQSMHPNIKSGEFFVCYIRNCMLDDVVIDAIGLFKSENKDLFLEITQSHENFHIEKRQGININKLDKGCIIFNTFANDGYIISIIDNSNRNNSARYWKDDFLNIVSLSTNFKKTNEILDLTKNFIINQTTSNDKIKKTDSIELLNRSIDYFKSHNEFLQDDFENSVFQDKDIIESFQSFGQNYQQENNVELSNNFNISEQAVKKKSKTFKRVLKLDKNFHIYIHGNRDLIKQGTDEDGRKYYKIYYVDET